MAIVGLTISANAISFRSKQYLCSGNERIIFYTNGTYELYNGSQLKCSGEYTLITDESAIRMVVGRDVLRMKAGITKGGQCTYFEYKDPDTGERTIYRPCK